MDFQLGSDTAECPNAPANACPRNLSCCVPSPAACRSTTYIGHWMTKEFLWEFKK